MIAECILTYEKMARDRVANEPDLQPYSHDLLDYDWGNMNEHYKWVATAQLFDVLDWCKECCATDEIVDILRKINALGTTVIMATHDLPVIEKAHGRVIEFSKGVIISDKKK